MNTKQRETKILHKDTSYIIQGCCFEIRKEYGAGQKESVYVNLLKEYLELKGLKAEKEKAIKIYSSKTGKMVGSYRPDLTVNGKIIIEIKSSSFTTKQDEKQIYHYLRNSEYELGYLVNFSTKRLFLKRIIYTNNRKPLLKILLCTFAFFFVLFSVSPSVAKAAEISFEAKTQEAAVGQPFQVNLVLNTDKEEINAVEGKIIFPSDTLELKEIKEANSIINFWLEKPKNNSNGQIVFSGITPGGYRGENGLLFSLIFLPKKEKQVIITIQEAKSLLNDGKGTETRLLTSFYQFSISQRTNASSLSSIIDKEPPESFAPEIAQNPAIADGKWFVVFATQDKGSGVDHYEIKETRQRTSGFLTKWINAESPYPLQDQELKSYIFVKAVDKSGNTRIEKISPPHPLNWYKNYDNWFIIILGIIIIACIKKFYGKRK